MKDLAGKVAVVTGGAAGIGRALGECFASERMKVVLADIDDARLTTTVKELKEQFDGVTEIVGVPTDVSLLESVEHLRDATLDAFGAVHLVCNNAGIPSGSEGQLWEHHLNDWRWAIDVNVYGVIHGINVFVPTMLAQEAPGHVVNTSSGNGGFAPMYNSAVYATTKAAVVTITECLWGQLHAIGAPISASVLFPGTRSRGVLNTGIWRPGRNRPARYAREGAPGPEGRDALAAYAAQLEQAGEPLVFAPLEEVAELCLQGILEDRFWIHVGTEHTTAVVTARAASIIDRTPPEYLLEPTPLNVPKK